MYRRKTFKDIQFDLESYKLERKNHFLKEKNKIAATLFNLKKNLQKYVCFTKNLKPTL